MKYSKAIKRLITAFLALMLMLTGLSGAYADFGGSSSGGGLPPPTGGALQPPPNVAPPVAAGTSTSDPYAYPDAIYYEYWPTAHTWACSDSNNPDAIGSFATYQRITDYGSTADAGPTAPDPNHSWSLLGYSSDGRSVWTRSSQVGAGCIYKPSYVQVFGGYCVVSSTATVEMTAPARVTLSSNTKVTPWGAGDKSIGGCNASQNSSVDVNTGTDKEGQYHAFGVSQVDVMWLKHYVSADAFGRVLPDEFLGYAPAPAQGAFNKIGTQNCSGWHPDVLLPFGNATQCSNQSSNTPTFTCEIGTTPLIDLRTSATAPERMGNFGSNAPQLLRDGISRRIDFTGGKGAPTLQGAAVSNVVGQNTNWTLGNFPWMSGVEISKNTTDFGWAHSGGNLISSYDARSATGNTWNQTGAHWNDTAVSFYNAGSIGTIATIQPHWTFMADVTSSSIIIRSIDPNSGTWVTSPSSTTNRDTASCDGNVLKAQPVRAIGDVITGK